LAAKLDQAAERFTELANLHVKLERS